MIRKERKSRLAKLDINRVPTMPGQGSCLIKDVEEVIEDEEESEHRTLNVQH